MTSLHIDEMQITPSLTCNYQLPDRGELIGTALRWRQVLVVWQECLTPQMRIKRFK